MRIQLYLNLRSLFATSKTFCSLDKVVNLALFTLPIGLVVLPWSCRIIVSLGGVLMIVITIQIFTLPNTKMHFGGIIEILILKSIKN